MSTIPVGRNSPAYQAAQQTINEGYRRLVVAGSNEGLRLQAQAMIAQGQRDQQVDHIVQAQRGGRPGNYNTTTGQFTPDTALPAPRPLQNSSAVWNTATRQWEPTTPDTAANAVPGAWEYGTNGRGEFNPTPSRPADAGYANMKTAYDMNSKEIGGIAEDARNAQADQIRVQEMRNILKTTDTGGGSETNAAIQAFLQRWDPTGLAGWTRDYGNLQGAAAIQMFQKLGFMGATSAEQQTTPRGGYQATKLFQAFNPGAQLLTSTNQGLLAQRLINNQQTAIDYNQGAPRTIFAQQERNWLSPNPSYSPLAQYDTQWQNQRNPQVYAAAIGALGGQDYNQWAKGLSEKEYKDALDVVSRADPSAVVNGKTGRISMQPQSGGQTQAQPNAGAPEVTATGPDGHQLVLRNGQWVPK